MLYYTPAVSKMKIHKKFGFKFLASLTFSLLSAGLFFSTHAYAASQSDVASCAANMRFVSVAEIDCTYIPTGTSTATTVKFYDVQPDDSDKFVGGGHAANYAWTKDMPFCDRGNTPGGGIDGGGRFYFQGISVYEMTQGQQDRSLFASDAGKSLTLRVVLGYTDPTTSKCVPYKGGGSVAQSAPDNTANVSVTGSKTQGISNLLKFGNSGQNISSLDNVSKGSLAGKSYNLTNYSNTNSSGERLIAYTGGGAGKPAYTPGSCQGEVILMSLSGSTTTANMYKITTGNNVDPSKYPDLVSFLLDPKLGATGCGVDSGAIGFNGAIGYGGFSLVGTPPTIAAINNAPKSGAGGGSATNSAGCSGVDIGTCSTELLNSPNGPDSSACVANSHTTLEWLICPLMTAISKMADQINGFVENMLNFDVEGTFPDCKDADDQNCGVNRAWSIIKNIVASLLVVIMLVMVISQAIGRGPFEAYTVKKILPRLVIAVILMQFSWVLTKYLITISNDLGIGIKQIMLAPFGGAGRLDLPSIMHHLNPAYPAATNWPVGLLMIGLLVAFKDFILPLVIFLAVAVGSALFVALATLVFRNIFIIMAVILSPIALLLWILPGQTFQGYWKKYLDNFTKILLLFPLVMATIYAGRIGAYLVGNTGWPSFINYIIVLIAYFGPMFYLPKTFKWGGSLLAGVNQAINTNKALGTAKKWGYGLAKDQAQDARGKRAYKYTDSEQKGARFNTYSKFGRGISKVPGLRRAFMDKNGKGRRLPLNETQRNMWGSGMVFQSQINKRKAARLGHDYKETTDSANEELTKRKEETARKPGEIAAMTIKRGPDGKFRFQAFAKDKTRRPSWAPGFAAAKRDLFSGDTRRAERAAQWFITHPEFGIHSNDMIPLDTKNQMWKDRQEFEKAEGMRAAFNADDMSKDDKNISETSRKDKKLLGEMADLDIKNRNGTITPAETARYDYLNYRMGLRVSNHLPYSDKEIHEMEKSLKFIKETDPRGAYYNDAVTGSKAEGGLPYARIQQLLPSQLKATSVHEVQQSMANMNYEDIPNVMGRLQENQGWKLLENDFDGMVAMAGVAIADPTSEEAAYFRRRRIDPNDMTRLVNAGFYNATDLRRYAGTDHSSYGRWASLDESALTAKAADDGKALTNLQWGYQDKDNLGGDTLLPGLSDFTIMTSGIIERQDPTLAQIMTSISQTPSKREQFLGWLSSSVPTTKDVGRMWRDRLKPGHAQFEPQILNSIRETLRTNHNLGLPASEGRPYTDRDIKVLEILPALRHYYPHFTPQHARMVYDQAIDPEGARRELNDHVDSDIPDDLIAAHPELQQYTTSSTNQQKIAAQAQVAIEALRTGRLNLSDIEEENRRLTEKAAAAIPTAPIPTPPPTAARPSTRLSGLTRAPIPDTPAARAAATQSIYERLSGVTGVTLPPTITAAIETAHTSFNDPRYARDPSRKVGFGNYNDEALIQKRRIIMNAVEATIPDKVFARKFAGEIIARGIAGEAGEATIVPEAPDSSEISIEHDDVTSSPTITAAATNISITQPTMAMPMVAPYVTPMSLSTPSAQPIIRELRTTTVEKSGSTPIVSAVPKNDSEVGTGSLHGQPSNTPTSGGLNLRGPQGEEFGFNIREAIRQSLKPVAEAARKGEKVDPSRAARNAENRINDVIDDMNKG